MKMLVITALIGTIIGCEHRQSDPVVKFNYGDYVTVQDGFYKGSSGTVESYSHCLVDTKTEHNVRTICYHIQYINEVHAIVDIGPISQQELTK